MTSSPRLVPPYLVFDRKLWSGLRAPAAGTPLELNLQALSGVNEVALQSEVEDVLLPLQRLIAADIQATRAFNNIVHGTFPQETGAGFPYIIAIAGSVAVGKSTFARLLREVLAQSGGGRHVELVTTDGFLFSKQQLLDKGLMGRKGFPESYDLPAMLKFLGDVKTGQADVQVPVYSHEAYDIVPGQFQHVSRPDILIFEGLNVLQTKNIEAAVASDFFDFSIYLDADTSQIETWYVERFLKLQRTVFQKKSSYFHHYKDLGQEEAVEVARGIWQQVNLPNLVENILPTRRRAHVVLRKGEGHQVEEVWLRQN